MLRLIRWLEGCVVFAILGENPAEALTLAARSGITVQRAEEKDGILYAVCPAADYRRLAALLRRRNGRRKPLASRPAVRTPAASADEPAPPREEWWEPLLRASSPPEAEPPKPPGRLERALSGPPPAWVRGKPLFRKRRRVRGLDRFQRECLIRAELRNRNALTLRVVRRKGPRFLLHRYRRRIGLPVGLVLAAAMILVLQGFVWDIEISGNERLPAGVYLDALARYGLTPGTRKCDVPTQEIVNRVALDHPEVGWMAVNLVGSRAYVVVSERTEAPESLAKDVPCNLVAAADGRIVSVNAFGGQKTAKPGMWVARGDLLVSGVFQAFLGGTHLVHAWGEVMAEVSHVLRVEVPMNITEWNASDSRAAYILELTGGLRFPISSPPAGQWVSTESTGQLSLLGVRLPGTLTAVRYSLTGPVERARTEAESATLARQLLQKKKNLLLGTNRIVSEQEEGWIENGTYILESRIVILQDIAREQEIYLSPPSQSPSSSGAEHPPAGR